MPVVDRPEIFPGCLGGAVSFPGPTNHPAAAFSHLGSTSVTPPSGPLERRDRSAQSHADLPFRYEQPTNRPERRRD